MCVCVRARARVSVGVGVRACVEQDVRLPLQKLVWWLRGRRMDEVLGHIFTHFDPSELTDPSLDSLEFCLTSSSVDLAGRTSQLRWTPKFRPPAPRSQSTGGVSVFTNGSSPLRSLHVRVHSPLGEGPSRNLRSTG